MKFLPFDKYTITTNKTKEEVIYWLKKNTNEGSLFKLIKSGDCYFNGEIKDDSFKIGQSTLIYNMFMPIITGSIEEGSENVKLNLKMRMSKVAIIFMALWMFLFGVLTGGLAYFMNAYSEFNSLVFISMGFLVYGYVVCMAAYKLPVRSCRVKFHELQTK